MFDHKPQELLIKVAEASPEAFETRVLRELAALGERLAKLEAASPQIVARRSGTFYDSLGSMTFTFSGVKDEDGISVDFTLDSLGTVRVERREVVEKQIAPGVREMYLAPLKYNMRSIEHLGVEVDFDAGDFVRHIYSGKD